MEFTYNQKDLCDLTMGLVFKTSVVVQLNTKNAHHHSYM